jgi:PTS hybrid protein
VSRCVVGLVLVAHSAKLAEGLADVAHQMAPDVAIRPAGGCPDGRIGTSYDRVEGAVKDLLDSGLDVVVLTDLGSASLMAEAVLEGLGDGRASFVDGPLVEGSVHAAVAAQTGGDCGMVRRAALRVAASYARSAEAELARATARRGQPTPSAGATAIARGGGVLAVDGLGTGNGSHEKPDGGAPQHARTLHLTNRLGLHARPAAYLARTAGAFDAVVSLNGVPATSVLDLMELGLEVGAEIRLAASGPEADEALDAVEELVLARFGEE